MKLLQHKKSSPHRRRGMTSVLAMLFLVLFGTMAIGFYAATNTASQVSANDTRVQRAFLAAESGLDFMRYQLAHVTIPPSTSADDVIDELYADLQDHLDETSNLGAYTISRSGNTISIPGPAGSKIPLDSTGETGFRATITDWAGEIVVKCDGYYGNVEVASRSITMDFSRQQRTTSAFDFAVASKGQIVMKKGKVTSVAGVDPKIAAMMSALDTSGAIKVTGGEIGGHLNIVEDASVIVTGGTVAESSVPATILATRVHEVDPPEFPTIDTTVYKKYATNNYVKNEKVQSNIVVKAGTNPKFNGGDTVQGIIYVESPNQVTFNGNFNLKGFLVMEPGASTTDYIEMSGNLTMSPLPSGSQFDSLRSTSGVAILAPKAAIKMTGSAGGNIKGNIIAETFLFRGSSDLLIDQGTLMTLHEGDDAAVFDTSKSIKFSSTGASNQPKAGVSYSSYYMPEPASYQEVTP